MSQIFAQYFTHRLLSAVYGPFLFHYSQEVLVSLVIPFVHQLLDYPGPQPHLFHLEDPIGVTTKPRHVKSKAQYYIRTNTSWFVIFCDKVR